MQRFAEAEGYRLAMILYEDESGRFPAFTELVEELLRADAYDAVIPTLDDLSGHRLIRRCMLERLEYHAGAVVHVMNAPATRARVPSAPRTHPEACGQPNTLQEEKIR